MNYSQSFIPDMQFEEVDKQELGVLDKTSITSVVDFMRKFQNDATFTPPTNPITFDSEKFDVNIDDDGEMLETYSELEDFDEVLDSARTRE